MGHFTREIRSRFSRQLAELFLYKVNREVEFMKQAERYSPVKLDKLRLEKINSLIKHFRSYPFYNQLLHENGIDNVPLKSLEGLESFPIVTKSVITENLEYIAKQPHAHKLNSTSGSTGVNFYFYQSHSMLTARSAAVRRCYSWTGIEYWGDRKMVIWGHSPSISRMQDFGISLKKLFLNTWHLQGYGLDAQTCRRYLQLLEIDKPAVLEGYPGYILMLAQVGSKENITPFCPKVIITSGEMLHDGHRRQIEEYFRVKIANRYGSREFGAIAQECKFHNGLHISPTRFIVHTDSSGELLITDLDNYATPFIRYAIDDLGSVEKVKCQCGMNVDTLVSLGGRSHDVIKTRSGKLLGGQFWTTASRAVGGIEEFQVIQRTIDKVEFKAKVTSDFDPARIEILRRKVKQIVGDELELNVTIVDHIEPTKMGKRRFIINLMEQGNA